jgi:hypothetical protein
MMQPGSTSNLIVCPAVNSLLCFALSSLEYFSSDSSNIPSMRLLMEAKMSGN